MTTFTSPFTGDMVEPTDVSYYELNFSSNVSLAWPQYQSDTAGNVAVARIMDCTPSTGGLNIDLPPGSQGSVGTDILFRNEGSYAFTVTDYSGDQSVTIYPGTARYFYLVDNSTTDGVWHNFTYGAGTSSADAASLAGAGLTNVAGQLATSTNVIEVSIAPNLTDASRALAYVWTGGLGAITLPSVSLLSAGWFVMFRNNGSGTVSVTPSGTATIDGSPTVTFNPGDSGIIVLDKGGNKFYTVGLATPATVTFTSATYDVDSVIGNTLNLVTYAPIVESFVALAGTRTQSLNVLLPATTQIYVFSNNTNNGTYNVTFQISGSSQTPIVIGTGVAAIVLSDGNNLFILTQVGQGYYFAENGSASAPAFSFNADPTTGMYLASIHQLGLAANGTNIMLLNASNPADKQITTDATFTAKLISGGVF